MVDSTTTDASGPVHRASKVSGHPPTFILTSIDSVRAFECNSPRGFSTFRRVEVEKARHCLKDKHIVFIGDSHTRFQFDALVVFLETGKHQSPISRSFGNRLSPDMPPLNAAGQSSVIRQEFHIAYNYPNGTYKSGTHACQKYYHNSALGLTVSLLGLSGYSYGHSPVGWPAGVTSQVPLAFGEKEWGPGGPEELVDVISKHFGQVDAIVMNVGQWKYWPSPRTGEWISKYRSKVSSADEAIPAIMDELKHFSSVVKKVCYFQPLCATVA